MLNSVDKVFERYIAAVCLEPFTYKGKRFQPKTVRVSPQIFRGFICHKFCGGCCSQRFTLDWLPFEPRPEGQPVKEKMVIVNDKEYQTFSYDQGDHSMPYCRNLSQETGYCGIHGVHPFSCDFELIRFISGDKLPVHRLNHQKFGRGWAMKRIDGERGALCEFTETSPEAKMDVIRKLKRLEQWCNYFEVQNKMGTIIAWAESDRFQEVLFV